MGTIVNLSSDCSFSSSQPYWLLWLCSLSNTRYSASVAFLSSTIVCSIKIALLSGLLFLEEGSSAVAFCCCCCLTHSPERSSHWPCTAVTVTVFRCHCAKTADKLGTHLLLVIRSVTCFWTLFLSSTDLCPVCEWPLCQNSLSAELNTTILTGQRHTTVTLFLSCGIYCVTTSSSKRSINGSAAHIECSFDDGGHKSASATNWLNWSREKPGVPCQLVTAQLSIGSNSGRQQQ